MPPSTLTYLRMALPSTSDVLGRADLVQRHGRRPDDRAAGLDRDDRHRDAEGGALGRHDAREVLRDPLDRGHDVGARVRDAESAAEVELGHVAAGEQRGVHDEQAPGGLGESVGLEDLRSDVRVQARGSAANRARGSAPRHPGPRPAGCRTSGPRARSPGTRGWRRARRELMRSRTACTAPVARAASATRSISTTLSRTIAPTPSPTLRSISARLLLLPWKPRRAGSTPAASATASSPPLQTSMLRPASSSSARSRCRGTPCPRSRPSRVPPTAAKASSKAALRRGGAGAGVVLVDDVERGAELGGERGRLDPVDRDGTGCRAGRAGRPDPGASAFASSGWTSHSGASGFADTSNLTDMNRTVRRANPAWSLKPRSV